MMRFARFSALLFAATIILPASAGATPVVAFGDSWANQSAGELYNALSAAGFPTLLVQNNGIGGTTADQYANADPTAITTAIAANPDAQWVYLSLGGNDTFNHYSMGMPGTSAAANDANLRTILDNVFLLYPDIRVVMFGYARTNFVQSAACMSEAETFFGVGTTQAQINNIFETEVGDVMSAIAATYPNVTYIPLWGILQADAGQTVTPNNPSPASYFVDCFHLNATGYRVVHDELVTNYWTAVTAPTASFMDDGTQRCVGETIRFTNTSLNETRVRWFVDGQASGTGNTLNVVLNTSGNVAIELRAFNTVWSDVAQQTIVVDPCRDAGVRDAGDRDAGDRDGGAPDAGDVDAGDIDAGDRDAGARDAGDRDGGPNNPNRDGGRDAGGVVQDGGPAIDGGIPGGSGSWTLGGGCTTTRGGSSSWILLLGAGLWWSARRRRNTNAHS